MNWLLCILNLFTPSVTLAASNAALDPLSYDGGAWSPYVVGAGIGILSWLTFYFSDKAIGASSFYATIAGALGKLFARRHTESLHYYQKNPPRFDWSVVFVSCTIIGAFIAAWTG